MNVRSRRSSHHDSGHASADHQRTHPTEGRRNRQCDNQGALDRASALGQSPLLATKVFFAHNGVRFTLPASAIKFCKSHGLRASKCEKLICAAALCRAFQEGEHRDLCDER